MSPHSKRPSTLKYKKAQDTAVPKFTDAPHETTSNMPAPGDIFNANTATTEQQLNNAKDAMSRLGYMGLIPFGFGAISLWLSPWLIDLYTAQTIQRGILIYGAIIASFMAGMNTGNNLLAGRSTRIDYLPNMVAAIFAWICVVPDGFYFITISPAWRTLGLAIIFAWLFFHDERFTQKGQWPKWYGELRFRLSAWVILALMAIFARLILWA